MVEYKSVKFKLSSWRKLRRAFYGRKNETFSDYIERIALVLSVQTIPIMPLPKKFKLHKEWKNEKRI